MVEEQICSKIKHEFPPVLPSPRLTGVCSIVPAVFFIDLFFFTDM